MYQRVLSLQKTADRLRSVAVLKQQDNLMVTGPTVTTCMIMW